MLSVASICVRNSNYHVKKSEPQVHLKRHEHSIFRVVKWCFAFQTLCCLHVCLHKEKSSLLNCKRWRKQRKQGFEKVSVRTFDHFRNAISVVTTQSRGSNSHILPYHRVSHNTWPPYAFESGQHSRDTRQFKYLGHLNNHLSELDIYLEVFPIFLQLKMLQVLQLYWTFLRPPSITVQQLFVCL